MKLRIWIGFDEHSVYSKKDRTMFYVLPADGNAERKLIHDKFIEADTYEEARDKMVARINEWYDHQVHMRDMGKNAESFKKRQAVEIVVENDKDRDTTSLSIHGMGPAKKSTLDSDLLDLMDLSGGSGDVKG